MAAGVSDTFSITLQNSPKKICMLIGQKLCFYMETQNCWHNDGMSKETLHFDDLLLLFPRYFTVNVFYFVN